MTSFNVPEATTFKVALNVFAIKLEKKKKKTKLKQFRLRRSLNGSRNHNAFPIMQLNSLTRALSASE